MKLSNKILIALIVPFLVIIGMYHVITTGRFTKYLEEVFRQQAESKLPQVENDIRAFFRTSEYQLELLAAIAPPQENDTEKTGIALQRVLQDVEPFFRISVINTNGKEWLRFNKYPSMDREGKLGYLFSDPIYQIPMLQYKSYYGKISRNEKFPLPFLNISVPVKKHDTGEITEILWAQISFQNVQTLLERYLSNYSKLILFDNSNGEIIAQADDTRMNYSDLEADAVRDVTNSGKPNGWFEKKDGPKEANFVFKKFTLGDLHLSLLYYQPNKSIYYLANRLKLYNFYVTLAGVIIFFVTSFILIRMIITPLVRLTQKITKLGERCRPNHEAKQETQKFPESDEVKQLSHAFMVFEGRLTDYQHDIESFNRTLEQQVEEKTSELKELNKTLADINEKLLHDIAKRKEVESELGKYQKQLELMVEDRTFELSETNKALGIEVDERRKTEKALAAEKERLAVTLRSISEGVITTGIDGKVLLINRMAEKLTGWESNDSVGKHLSEIYKVVSAKTGNRCNDCFQEIMNTGNIETNDDGKILLAKDGTQRNIEDSGATIRDAESRVVGVVIVFRDVTERNRLEEELLKSKKIESVGILAGGIAHDFNNILAAIMGNLSLAAIMTRKDEEVNRLLTAAEKATFRAKDLTNQLLTFSKGGAPVKTVASIQNIITDSAEFVLRGSNVKCRYEFPEDLWPVEIDKGQISQVIQNIILNARDAMPESGIITISCENFIKNMPQPLPLASGPYVKITIIDQGIGISPHLLDKIFDPYFTTKQKGSGLGLAITHSIITKHGGYISVSSEPGVGTTFSIYIHANTEKPEVPSLEKERAINSVVADKLVMIMDDDEMVRKTVGEMMAYLGCDMIQAETGEEALQKYKQFMNKGNPINLVIMDLTIPGGMGGREAVEELLKIDPKAKAVVASGYSNHPVMSKYKEYGFVGVLNKPFQIAALNDLFQNVFGEEGKTP